jgi:hypothetical protein
VAGLLIVKVDVAAPETIVAPDGMPGPLIVAPSA